MGRKNNKIKEFTASKLRDYLNEKFNNGVQFKSKPFTIQDIEGYTRRRKLPDRYGGNELRIYKSELFNITIIELLPQPEKQEV